MFSNPSSHQHRGTGKNYSQWHRGQDTLASRVSPRVPSSLRCSHCQTPPLRHHTDPGCFQLQILTLRGWESLKVQTPVCQWQPWENSARSPLQTSSLPLSFFIFLLEGLFLLQGSLPAPQVLPLLYHCQLTELAAIGSSKITFTHRQPQWDEAATPELSFFFFL